MWGSYPNIYESNRPYADEHNQNNQPQNDNHGPFSRRQRPPTRSTEDHDVKRERSMDPYQSFFGNQVKDEQLQRKNRELREKEIQLQQIAEENRRLKEENKLKNAKPSEATFSSDKTECAICTDSYEDGAKIMSTQCGHTFHKECLMQWFERKHVCPMCKTPQDLSGDFKNTNAIPSPSANNLERALATSLHEQIYGTIEQREPNTSSSDDDLETALANSLHEQIYGTNERPFIEPTNEPTNEPIIEQIEHVELIEEVEPIEQEQPNEQSGTIDPLEDDHLTKNQSIDHLNKVEPSGETTNNQSEDQNKIDDEFVHINRKKRRQKKRKSRRREQTQKRKSRSTERLETQERRSIDSSRFTSESRSTERTEEISIITQTKNLLKSFGFNF